MYCDGFIFKWNDKIQKRLLCELTGFDFTQRVYPTILFTTVCTRWLVKIKNYLSTLWYVKILNHSSRTVLYKVLTLNSGDWPFTSLGFLGATTLLLYFCRPSARPSKVPVVPIISPNGPYRHADVFASPTCERIAMNKRIFVNLSAPRSIR